MIAAPIYTKDGITIDRLDALNGDLPVKSLKFVGRDGVSSAPLSHEELLRHPALWRGGSIARTAIPGVSSGFPELDAELPGGGWPAGVLTEILPAHEGIGEVRLFGPALASLSARNERLAWIAPPYLPYAPALTAAGIDLSLLLVVRTKKAPDALWAAAQAIASNTCGAVLAWLPAARYTDLRRLQLAAERSRTLVVLFRPPRHERESSPAALRIALGTADGRLELHIIKRRGISCRQPIRLPAHPLHARRHAMDRPALALPAARNPAARITLA